MGSVTAEITGCSPQQKIAVCFLWGKGRGIERAMADAGDVRRSVADRASSYSRVVDEGKVI